MQSTKPPVPSPSSLVVHDTRRVHFVVHGGQCRALFQRFAGIDWFSHQYPADLDAAAGVAPSQLEFANLDPDAAFARVVYDPAVFTGLFVRGIGWCTWID